MLGHYLPSLTGWYDIVREGQEAAKRGQKMDSNPYQEELRRYAWELGYTEMVEILKGPHG